MNEAPFSATYKVLSPEGYEVLVSVRADTRDKALTIMSETEELLKVGSYTPINRNTGRAVERGPVPPRMQEAAAGVGQAIAAQNDLGPCPKCGMPLVEATTKTGKRNIKCTTNKWDFKTKSATGCDYIKWLDDGQSSMGGQSAPSATGDEASQAQKNIILEKWPDEWFNGMSKTQASAVISRNLVK